MFSREATFPTHLTLGTSSVHWTVGWFCSLDNLGVPTPEPDPNRLPDSTKCRSVQLPCFGGVLYLLDTAGDRLNAAGRRHAAAAIARLGSMAPGNNAAEAATRAACGCLGTGGGQKVTVIRYYLGFGLGIPWLSKGLL